MMQDIDGVDNFTNLVEGKETQSSDPTADFASLFNEKPSLSPYLAARYAGQAAMIQGSPEDNAVLGMASMHPDPKSERLLAVNAFYDKKQQDLQRWVEGSMEASPAIIEQVLTQAQQVQLQNAQDSVAPEAPEAAYMAQVAPNSEAEVRRNMALNVAAANDMADIVDEQGWLETSLDFLGAFLPFGTALDIMDIDDAVKEDPKLQDLDGDSIESIVMSWQALTAERKEKLYPHLRDAIIRATETNILGFKTDGNMLRAQQLLLSVLSSEGAEGVREEQALDIAFSVGDVTPGKLVTSATALATMARMSRTERVAAEAVLRNAAVDAVAKTNPIHSAADAGDITAAAQHTVTAMTNEAAGAAMHVPPTSAAMNGMPIQTKEWFTEVSTNDALPAAIAEQLNSAVQRAAGYARSLTTESDLMQLGALTASERQQAVKSFFEKMEGVGEEYLNEGLQMDNLRILNETPEGFTYQFSLRDKGPVESAVLREGEVKFRINDVTGTYEATINDAVSQQTSKILSPAAASVRTLAGDFNLDVKRSIMSSDLAAAVAAKNADMWQWAAEPVSGIKGLKARGRVEDVLEAGDEYINEATQVTGRVFTPTELIAGIETRKGTVRLTSPAEQEAYYRMRMAADANYMVENYVLRRELELGGFQQVKMFGKSIPDDSIPNVNSVRMAAQSLGRPFDDLTSALASVRDKAGQGIWDDKLGKVVDIGDDYVRQIYDEGDVLVRLRNDWNTKGTGDLDGSGEMVSYVRVSKDRISELPTQVLNYKHGYVPKINQAEWVVKQAMPVIKRGVPGTTRTQAMRAFDSLSDANRFREELIAKYMNNHQVSREDAELVFPQVNRIEELTTAERLEEAVGAHGGLFHGTRSKDELLFGLSGQRLERVSPFEAFQRQTAHLGTFVARNELRVGQERRWLNTVRREFPDLKIKGFDSTAIPSDTPKGRALERVRQQIREWNGIPTREESLFQASVQQLHDWALNGVRKLPFGTQERLPISLQWLKHSNPIIALKSAVMHNLLGMFNVAQLYTQASAAVVAATKYPQLAAKSFTDAFMYQALDNVRNETALGKVYNLLLRDQVIDKDALDAYAAYRRTGLYEAVFNNVDMAKISADGLGLTSSIMRKADTLSLVLYRGGEAFNRRFSFSVEYNAWKARTGKSVPTDAELEGILEQANLNMLELNAANSAWWQGGRGTGVARQILGMATQFLQVTAKTMELIFKSERRGGFTGEQRARIFAGQAALFGAAGVPMGAAVAPAIANWLGITEMDEETAQLANQGLVGFGVNTMLGSDLDISNRFALGGSVTTLVKDIMTSEDPLWIKALGPAAGGLGGRMWDSIKELQVLSQADRAGAVDLTDADVRMAFAALAQIPSSTRNFWKAWVMSNYHQILDRRSNSVVNKDFEFWTELGTSIGFRPTAETDARMLQLTNRDMDELVTQLADVRVNLMYRAVFQLHLDERQVVAYANAMQVLDETTPDWVKSKVRERIADRVFGDNAESIQERELKKFFERTVPNKVSADALLDAGFNLNQTDQPFTRPFKEILGGSQIEE